MSDGIEELEKEIELAETRIADLENQLEEKDELIAKLKDQLAEARGLFDDMAEDCRKMIRDIERSRQ